MTSIPASAPTPAVPVAHERAAPPALPRLSSGFGYRSDPLHGIHRMHKGIDIPGPLGAPVQASADGIVRSAGAAGSYGNMIEIDHGGGLTTRYAHLSRLLVATGMPVERGQTIALIGSTGRSTGNHLHFEVRVHGQAEPPLAYLSGDTEIMRAPVAQTEFPAEPHVSAFAQARATAKPAKDAGL
jgi:murein DD-endopeptidase MepM/ murein hydrolase activator NlpD